MGRLLPRLTRDAYFLEPGLAQLAAMARAEPGALGAVANFAVCARGLGRVRWLEPVDVRGLDLDAIVRLGKGSVEARPTLTLPTPRRSRWPVRSCYLCPFAPLGAGRHRAHGQGLCGCVRSA